MSMPAHGVWATTDVVHRHTDAVHKTRRTPQPPDGGHSNDGLPHAAHSTRPPWLPPPAVTATVARGGDQKPQSPSQPPLCGCHRAPGPPLWPVTAVPP